MVNNSNGDELTDPLLISEAFNDYFSTVAQNLNNNIQQSNSDPLNYISYSRHNSFFVEPVSISEVIDTITSLPNKGGHVDSIPTLIYKRVSHLVAPIIADIFNWSV